MPTRVACLVGEDTEEVDVFELYAEDSPGSRLSPSPPPREEAPYPQDLLSSSAALLLRLPFTDCVSLFDLSGPVQLPVPTAQPDHLVASPAKKGATEVEAVLHALGCGDASVA